MLLDIVLSKPTSASLHTLPGEDGNKLFEFSNISPLICFPGDLLFSAGASGSFNAGVERGKLVADMAGLLAGGAGVVKGGVVLTEKIAAKVAGKAELEAVNAGNAANYAGLKLD